MEIIQNLSVAGVHPPKTKLGAQKLLTLVEAAEKLFTRESFFQVSVSDICKEAHTAVGTFYIYFESKTDLYRYLVAQYKKQIKHELSRSIAGYTNRLEVEREGIKCFIRYSVANPQVYNIIWGSLAVEREMFEEYYTSFARSYARALQACSDELSVPDVTTLAYTLMGIANFLGLRAIFENMNEESINAIIDENIIPLLEKGMFR